MAKNAPPPQSAAKADVPPDEEAKASGKKRLLIFAIGGVLSLAAVGGGITFFLARGSSGEQTAQAAPTSSIPDNPEHKEVGPEDKKTSEQHEKKDTAAGDKKDPSKGEKKKEEGTGDKKDHKSADPTATGTATTTGKKLDPNDSTVKIDGIDFGCTHTFPMFNLNLGNPLENRYMRLEVAVEYGCGSQAKAELDRRAPQLRDAIASVARRKTREFMLGPDGLDQLRKEIHIKLNGLLTHKVDKIFITDILIE